ncbi:LysR family transcriptional regulator [Bradyrhizobium sp. CCGUVB4N]|uniref:LysR family transcriptional regulator n=1 Tax=Bradyrhizobium sp. CCGUVB4N TaxID=2949631 RepID=UPI0020B28412|nr:LysR family transcriptional regulator [Bradyrhizobium sp. CCGUVB4N]MCP3380205.1 LysR family transcriptional regulator [Bradyrhizobium sp. CCGUVB4N]
MVRHTSFVDLVAGIRRLNLDLGQLQLAIAAAECGSFRRAADSLSITQSTLSRSIQLLEHSIGIVIFERSRAGVTATPAGIDFLRIARSILEQMDTVVARAKPEDREEYGRLVIGFSTSLTAGHLRATLLEYCSRFPQATLRILERSRSRLATALRNGMVDLYVAAGDSFDISSRSTSLWSERILAALPQDHSLVQQDALSWTDLSSQIILMSQYDSGRDLEALLNGRLITSMEGPRIEHRDVSRGELQNLVSMGLGITLVLESDVGANSSGLVYRELRYGAEPSRVGFSAVWRDDNENPALASFLKLLAERYPSSSLA